MDGGTIELLAGDDSVLAMLWLYAVGGELELNTISEGIARVQGRAATARVVASNGAGSSASASRDDRGRRGLRGRGGQGLPVGGEAYGADGCWPAHAGVECQLGCVGE